LTADAGIKQVNEQIQNIEQKRAATSIQQSAEWGI
jgi:hypothetical protein